MEPNFGKWNKSNKHVWQLDENGEIDTFAYDNGFHNGPICTICHRVFCHHCEPDCYESECQETHYECSNCGHISFTNADNYCSNCGSKMNVEEA